MKCIPPWFGSYLGHMTSSCRGHRIKSVSHKKDLGPVVQSIVSLTSSLRGQLVKCFRLYNQIHWYFLLQKWEKFLQCKSFSHFSNEKYWHIWNINVWNFNDTLTNNVVSFEQLGPSLLAWAKANSLLHKKNFVMVPELYVNWFLYNFPQVLNMTISKRVCISAL